MEYWSVGLSPFDRLTMTVTLSLSKGDTCWGKESINPSLHSNLPLLHYSNKILHHSIRLSLIVFRWHIERARASALSGDRALFRSSIILTIS